MALVFLATQSVVPCRHNEGVLDRHRPRLTNRKSNKPNRFSSFPRKGGSDEPLHKLRSPSVDDVLFDEEALFAKDDIDVNKTYVSDDDDEDDEDFRTFDADSFCNNNNDFNFNLDKLRKPADPFIRSSVEAFPSSFIKWPLNNGIKSKRLSDIRKQVKHLSKTIKMTIDSDDKQSPKGQLSNPPPFSSHVDMSLLKDVPSSSSSSQWPSIQDVEAVLKSGKGKETKALLRHSNWGIDHIIRKHLWKSLVQHQARDSFGTDADYWENVQQMYGSKDITECNIVLPAFVDHNHVQTYGLSTDGIKACERVISVIAYNHPAITYAPIMYPLTALFMHYLEEPDVFNCMTFLVNKSSDFISQTKLLHEATWRTLDALAKKHVRGSYGMLNKYGITPEQRNEGFQTWTWWMFAKLPFTHLIRIVDCFLKEGRKVLLRSSLGLFHIFMKQVNRDTNTAAALTTKGLSEATALYCSNIQVSPSKLLKTAFGIRALSKNDIKKVIAHFESAYKHDHNVGSTSGVCGGELVRSASMENLPSSESQENIQAASHTLNIKERSSAQANCPVKTITSGVIDYNELLTIWSWIPMRITMSHPRLIFTTEEHGCSLTNFYMRVEKLEPALLLVRTTNDEVFGAYCSTAWNQRKFRDEYGHKQTYFGTGETFLFTLKPEVKKYAWVGITRQRANREIASIPHQSELFLHADHEMITVGGGQGHGLMLDQELRYGKTERCDTFNNEPLCSSSNFEIKVVEVFSFQDNP